MAKNNLRFSPPLIIGNYGFLHSARKPIGTLGECVLHEFYNISISIFKIKFTTEQFIFFLNFHRFPFPRPHIYFNIKKSKKCEFHSHQLFLNTKKQFWV